MKDQKLPELSEKIAITNEIQLRKMLQGYQPGVESQARKTLLDSLELIKARIDSKEHIKKVDEKDFGGYKPAPLIINESIPGLDVFIRDRMGGRREGTSIFWIIDEVKWVFNPWNGELKRDN